MQVHACDTAPSPPPATATIHAWCTGGRTRRGRCSCWPRPTSSRRRSGLRTARPTATTAAPAPAAAPPRRATTTTPAAAATGTTPATTTTTTTAVPYCCWRAVTAAFLFLVHLLLFEHRVAP